MKLLTKAGLVVLLAIACQRTVFAKDWRGITPLHSTAAEVERQLGPPAKRSAFFLYYNLSDEIAVIRIQNESCDSFGGKFGFGWNVPPGTVAEIGVIPKSVFKKDRFVVGSDFKSENANAGFLYFTNDKDGVEVETYNGNVTLVTYSPPVTEAHLHCPRVQQCCVDFFPKFDEYGQLVFKFEKPEAIGLVVTAMAGILGAYAGVHLKGAANKE